MKNGGLMEKEKLGTLPYVISGLSYIPLIGVLFGLISIVWGLVTNKLGGKKLALIGFGGIVFTIILYSSLFYFGFKERGGVYDGLRVKLAQSSLLQAVQSIEFYKVQNGKYPISLEVLKKSLPQGSMVNLMDVTDVSFEHQPRYFHYELIDDKSYYLLGLGVDNIPYTKDDILPTINLASDSKVGLKIKSIRK